MNTHRPDRNFNRMSALSFLLAFCAVAVVAAHAAETLQPSIQLRVVENQLQVGTDVSSPYYLQWRTPDGIWRNWSSGTELAPDLSSFWLRGVFQSGDIFDWEVPADLDAIYSSDSEPSGSSGDAGAASGWATVGAMNPDGSISVLPPFDWMEASMVPDSQPTDATPRNNQAKATPGPGSAKLAMQNSNTRLAVSWQLYTNGTLRGYTLIRDEPITAGWDIIAMADIDSDGVPDLVMQNMSTRLAVVWFLEPDGVLRDYQLIQETPITAGWTIKAAVDVDDDGTPDLIMENLNTRLAVVWFLNADGTLKSYQLIQETPITTGWTIKAAADVDGDGTPDLIMENMNTRLAVVWFLNSDGTLKDYQLVQEAPITAGWTIKAAADVDGDGTPDVIMENMNTRLAVVWFLNTDGTLKSYQLIRDTPITSGWTIKAAVDVDGDTTPDVIMENLISRLVVVWFLNTDGTLKSYQLVQDSPITSGWTIKVAAD